MVPAFPRDWASEGSTVNTVVASKSEANRSTLTQQWRVLMIALSFPQGRTELESYLINGLHISMSGLYSHVSGQLEIRRVRERLSPFRRADQEHAGACGEIHRVHQLI